MDFATTVAREMIAIARKLFPIAPPSCQQIEAALKQLLSRRFTSCHHLFGNFQISNGLIVSRPIVYDVTPTITHRPEGITMQEFRKMAAAMDQRASQLMKEGVTSRELMHRMVGHMPDLQRIWVGANDQQLAMLCQDYPGFYKYASLMEEGAESARANPQKYQDLPELNDLLKPLFAGLLTDAATLEHGYQSLIEDRNRPGIRRLTDELHECHRNWLAERERFILALKVADVPKLVLEVINPAMDEMADRIAQLKIRASSQPSKRP